MKLSKKRPKTVASFSMDAPLRVRNLPKPKKASQTRVSGWEKVLRLHDMRPGECVFISVEQFLRIIDSNGFAANPVSHVRHRIGGILSRFARKTGRKIAARAENVDGADGFRLFPSPASIKSPPTRKKKTP